MAVRAFVSGDVVVVVEGSRIGAVGPRSLLTAWPTASVVEVGAGRRLVPGFIDAHYHLCFDALHPRWADLSGVGDEGSLRDQLQIAALASPEAEWIRGHSWDPTLLRIDAAMLDSLGFDRPVLVASFSYHEGVVDSRGLDALSMSSGDGRLLEAEWGRAHAASLSSYTDPDRWGELIEQRARELLAVGITAVHDAACPPAAEAVYRSLAAAGRLPVSVLAMTHPWTFLSGLDSKRLADGPPTGDGDETFRVGPVKLFADGGVAMAIDVHISGRRRVNGPLFAGVDSAVRAAVAADHDVAIHAMGNAALDVALDAFESVASSGRRMRIEHAVLASLSQLERMASLGVTAVVQPGFVSMLGPRVAHRAYDDAVWMPFASMAAAGVRVAASSDGPCDVVAPVAASLSAAARPIEGVPFDDWLHAWTAGAAAAGGQEDERGTLRPGLRADLVILEGETVAETWVAGERVFSA
jgi:predicted amidohydrolase YtcJ